MSSKWLLSKWGCTKSSPSCHKYKWLDIVCNKPSGENYMICYYSYNVSQSLLIYFHWQGNLILQRTLIGERETWEIVNQAVCACVCACTSELTPGSSPGPKKSLRLGLGGFPCLSKHIMEVASHGRKIQGYILNDPCEGMKVIKIWTRVIQIPKTGPL